MAFVEYEFNIDTRTEEHLDFITNAIRLIRDVSIIGDEGHLVDVNPEMTFVKTNTSFAIRYRIPNKKDLIIKDAKVENDE